VISIKTMNFAVDTTRHLENVLDEDEYQKCLDALRNLIEYHRGNSDETEVILKIIGFCDDSNQYQYSSREDFVEYCKSIKNLSKYWFTYEKERMKNDETFSKEVNPPYFILLVRFYYSYLISSSNIV
jgi:hypothetical protein